STSIGQATGDSKMMKGYIDNTTYDPTITVGNLPYNAFHVYVYFNSDTGGGSAIGRYNLYVGGHGGSVDTNIFGKDAGTLFNGTFVKGGGTNPADPNAAGNYVVFYVTNKTGFDLTVSSESLRAVVNGIQIVLDGTSPTNDFCSDATTMTEGIVYTANTVYAT